MVRNSSSIASIFCLAVFCAFTSLHGAEINKTYPKKESIRLEAISGSPDFDVSATSATSDAILNFNRNPLKGSFEFTAIQGSGRIASPVKFENEETISDEHFQYGNKSFRVDGQNTPRIHIETGTGLAKLVK